MGVYDAEAGGWFDAPVTAGRDSLSQKPHLTSVEKDPNFILHNEISWVIRPHKLQR